MSPMSGPWRFNCVVLCRRKKVPAEDLVTHLIRVEIQLNRFGVAGSVGADFFIGRTFGVTAAVADPANSHAGNLIEIKLHAPKAASRKYSIRFISPLK